MQIKIAAPPKGTAAIPRFYEHNRTKHSLPHSGYGCIYNVAKYCEAAAIEAHNAQAYDTAAKLIALRDGLVCALLPHCEKWWERRAYNISPKQLQ